jgi:hypothetical protein
MLDVKRERGMTRGSFALLPDRYYDLCILHRKKYSHKGLIGQLSTAGQWLANKHQLDDMPQLKNFGDFYTQVHIFFYSRTYMQKQ